MFKPNDFVIYPSQGMGIIERIDRQDISGMTCEFYIVRIKSNNITLMVPINKADNVGLRKPVNKEQAETIMQSLRDNGDRNIFIGQNWNRRFKEYTERIKSKDLIIVTEALRELLLIGRNKELSFGEKRLQEQALGLVSGELSNVLQIDEENIKSELFELYPPYTPEQDQNNEQANDQPIIQNTAHIQNNLSSV